MTRKEAKDILQLCRPDRIEDLNDPLILKAMEFMEQDSELSAWFEESQLFDAEIHSELKKIEVPSDLKSSILSGLKAQSAQPEVTPEAAFIKSESDSKDSPSRSFWYRPLIGIAACLVFAGAFWTLLPRNPGSTTANNDPTPSTVASSASLVPGNVDVPDLIQFLSQQINSARNLQFDKRSNQVNELQSYLALAGVPNPEAVPQRLVPLPTIGCVTFDYNGAKLSMICFRDGQVYHLITANIDDLGEGNLSGCDSSKESFFEHDKQIFKLWFEGNQVHVLCTKGTKEQIPEFI